MSQIELRNEGNKQEEAEEEEEEHANKQSKFPINHHRINQGGMSITRNKASRGVIFCSLCCALLINLLRLAGPAEAGRLQDFFQSLVGNSGALLSSLSSSNNKHNEQDHQFANRRIPNANSNVISQRTSASWSGQGNALDSVAFDLDSAASNHMSSQAIHLSEGIVGGSTKLSGLDEPASRQPLMSPMMPSISPYVRYPSFYYRYSSESFAPVASPRYGGASAASSLQNNQNSFASLMGASARMSVNSESANVIQQRNSVINNSQHQQQQQNLQILTPISSSHSPRLNQSGDVGGAGVGANKWPSSSISRQSGGLGSPAALASSPLASMFDVFGAASQYLMHFKPSSFIGQPGTLQMPILASHIPQIIEHNQQQHLTPIRNNNNNHQHRHIIANQEKKSTSSSDILHNNNNQLSHPMSHHHHQHHHLLSNQNNQNNNFIMNADNVHYAIQQQRENNLTNDGAFSSSPKQSPLSSAAASSASSASSPFPVVHFATSNYTKSLAYQTSPAFQHQYQSHHNSTHQNPTSPSTTTSSTTSSPAALALATSPAAAAPVSQQGFFSRLVSSSLGLMSGQSSQGSAQRREDVCGRTIQTPERRIIGGEGARYGEFPYQVHIKIAKHQCGGALVDRQSIVTAAHCVYHFITRAPVNKLQIVIGAYDIEDEQYQELPPQYFKVNKVKLHPNFRFSASHPDRYDVAILKLDKPVKYTDNVLPVCLPARDLNFESLVGTVTGFGKTDPSLSNRYGTRLLQKVDVPIIENSECERWHRTRGIDLKIFPEMMCAGYEDGLKDACVGDSGGPLVVKSAAGPNGAFRWTLAGITSAGFGCAQSRQPGIYHRVSHTVDWILENLD